jgi:hypothetical protein
VVLYKCREAQRKEEAYVVDAIGGGGYNVSSKGMEASRQSEIMVVFTYLVPFWLHMLLQSGRSRLTEI